MPGQILWVCKLLPMQQAPPLHSINVTSRERSGQYAQYKWMRAGYIALSAVAFIQTRKNSQFCICVRWNVKKVVQSFQCYKIWILHPRKCIIRFITCFNVRSADWMMTKSEIGRHLGRHLEFLKTLKGDSWGLLVCWYGRSSESFLKISACYKFVPGGNLMLLD